MPDVPGVQVSRILAYVPTYSPFEEADVFYARATRRLTQQEIAVRLGYRTSRAKPWMYMDSIDSILNVGFARGNDIDLVVGDGRSTDSIRSGLSRHHMDSGGYHLELYHDRLSQWVILNDILRKHVTKETEYFVYSSSDVIWQMDWVGEAIRAFEADPKLQLLFPLVGKGDNNIPCQVSPCARDEDPQIAPYDVHGKAPVLNAYAMIFRMDFFRKYGGYPDIFRNCYTESFLSYLCEAMGGEMRLLPRGWVYHWSLGDAWQENGSHYYFNEDQGLFQDVMTNVQLARAAGVMTPEFLKGILWKPVAQDNLTEEQQHRLAGGTGE